MKPLLFTDLDDTLFQTARKMSETPNEKRIASHAGNGSHSYMTDAQMAQFDWLNATTTLIPVTARSLSALKRCTLPFRSYQVVSNGAVILDSDLRPDQDWMSRLNRISAEWSGMLEMLNDFVAERNTEDRLRHWIVQEQGNSVYICVKSNGDIAWLDEIEDKLDAVVQGALFKHRNGNNLAYMPFDISKKSAVDHLIGKLAEPGTPIWGMGDSITDLPFMRSCQMMVVPAGSQLDKAYHAKGKENV